MEKYYISFTFITNNNYMIIKQFKMYLSSPLLLIVLTLVIGGNHLGGRALQFLHVEKYLDCPQGSYYSILYRYRVTLSFSHKAEEQIVFFKDPTACACASQRNFDL